MRLPRRIDDGLKDAIVSFQFTPGVPSEAVIGYIHAAIKDKAQMAAYNQPSAVPLTPTPFVIENRTFFFLSQGGQFRIDVDNQNITFNLVEKYAGWEAYQRAIQSILIPILESSAIASINRLGVRYISQFDNVHILDEIEATVSLNVELINASPRKQIRFEAWQEALQTIVTIVDGYPVQPNLFTTPSNSSFFSLIDIDVIQYFKAEQQNWHSILFERLEKAHQHEKTLFFQLLKDNFLQKLNPVY